MTLLLSKRLVLACYRNSGAGEADENHVDLFHYIFLRPMMSDSIKGGPRKYCNMPRGDVNHPLFISVKYISRDSVEATFQ